MQTQRDRLILVRLALSKWGARKFDKTASDEIARAHGAGDTGDNVGRFNKILVNPKAILPVHQAFNELRNRHIYLTAPWADDGVRVLPAALYFDYQTKVREARALVDAAVKQFVEVDYRLERKAAEKRLGTLFKESDYPSEADISRRFGIDVRFEPLPNPEDVRVWGIGDVAAEQVQREVKANLEKSIAEAHERVVEDVTTRAREFIDKVRDYDKRLATAKEDERVSGLRESALENLRDVVTVVLRGLNITNDASLTKFAHEIESAIRDVSIDELRDGEGLRLKKTAEIDAIASKFAGIFPSAKSAGGAR